MRRLFVISAHLMCVWWASPAYSTSILQNLNPQSFKPTFAECDFEISYTYYDICYSLAHRQSLWAKHELTRAQIEGKQKRTNDFKSDFQIPDPVDPRDYRHSGFDRGHLVPAADMKLNKTAMSDSFFMTNMSPQNSNFNSGIWSALEAHIRNEVLELGPAIIITAPILLKSQNYPRLKTQISVPDQFYKIAYFYEARQMKAYLIPNQPSGGKKFQNYQTSVRNIEAITGINFFSELEQSLQDHLESNI